MNETTNCSIDLFLARERERRLEALLQELVDLKDHKDQYGKTDYYRQHQPDAWRRARKELRERGRGGE